MIHILFRVIMIFFLTFLKLFVDASVEMTWKHLTSDKFADA